MNICSSGSTTKASTYVPSVRLFHVFFFFSGNRYKIGRGHGRTINNQSSHGVSLTQLEYRQPSRHPHALSTSPPKHPRDSFAKARVPKFPGEMGAQVSEGWVTLSAKGGKCVVYVMVMMG